MPAHAGTKLQQIPVNAAQVLATLSLPRRRKHLHGVDSKSYSALVRKPVPSRQILVANNDWWLEESKVDLIAPYWAEVGLRVAEDVRSWDPGDQVRPVGHVRSWDV